MRFLWNEVIKWANACSVGMPAIVRASSRWWAVQGYDQVLRDEISQMIEVRALEVRCCTKPSLSWLYRDAHLLLDIVESSDWHPKRCSLDARLQPLNGSHYAWRHFIGEKKGKVGHMYPGTFLDAKDDPTGGISPELPFLLIPCFTLSGRNLTLCPMLTCDGGGAGYVRWLA